jgi:hypothetical protein
VEIVIIGLVVVEVQQFKMVQLVLEMVVLVEVVVVQQHNQLLHLK